MKKVIVIPTYNEKENITELLPMLFSYLPNIYVVVVDDNSPDGTSDRVREMKSKYEHLDLIQREKKEGLGRAYIHAFREVLKDKDVETVIMMDADLSHDPKYLSTMLEKSIDKDVVVGSRYMKGGGTMNWEPWRRLLSRGGNMYCRFITGLPIKDCTGGFNVMRASYLRNIDFTKFDVSGYAFVMRLKYAFFVMGARFTEVPIIFTNRKSGVSKMSGHIIREGVIAPWKMRLKMKV